MPKRRRTQENHSGLDSNTFLCKDQGLLIILIFPGEQRCFYGAARIQCLAGELFVDGFAVPTGGVDLDKMHLMCAPYRFGRPAVLCASRSDILSVNYKLNRLKYRLKEVTNKFELVMNRIGQKHPAVVLVDRKPTHVIQLMDQLVEEMFVPLSMRSMCHFDRSAFFTSAFQPYTNECQKEMDLLFNRINSKRNEGMKCVIIPTGGKGAGKSTLVRYLINRLIHHDRPPVYLLDVDVGQTEFTPAGCMSLWKLTTPILDLPFTHQQLFYSSSYFYGNISPADDTAKYKDIFDRLLNEFNSHSDPGSLVVINTMGWLEGLGKDLLDYIFEMSRPFLAIVLPHDRGAYQVPSWVPNSIHVRPMFAPGNYVAEQIKNYRKLPSLPAAQLRDLSLIGYFASSLPRPVLSSLNEVAPYRIKFESITICVPEDYSYVEDKYFFGTLNAQVVALCKLADESDSLDTRRILNNETLPLVSTIGPCSPILKCFGFAIIRAIDIDKKLFYIITPLPPSELNRITIFARGTDILLPHQVFTSQTATNVPYLSRPSLESRSSLIADLYGALRNVGQHKRGYFPQVA